MDFEEAYLKIVDASKEKDTVEIPTILSCVEVNGKRCLEIGCGVLARLAIKFVEAGAEHVTCLENYDKTMEKARKIVSAKGFEDRIDILLNKGITGTAPNDAVGPKKKLPFSDGEFDIVYGSWLPHKLTTNQNFLSEIFRVCKENVLLVMPGIDDDIVKMKSIVHPGEKERRENYRREIVSYLEGRGMNVSVKEGMLKLDFDSFEDIKGVFDAFDFQGEYDGKEGEVDNYLRERIHNMVDGFYCIVGSK